MNMHKNTRLTPYHREEIWRLYNKEKVTVTYLAERFNVSRPTIYNALRLARLRLFKPQSSTNERFKTIKYGIKRVDCIYSDNGREYKGNIDHAFVHLCRLNHINQKFTRPARPQTNGKAERVIRTLMEMWHEQESFLSSEDRKAKIKRFLNFYNTVKPHKGLNGLTPYEVLDFYFK